MIANQMIIGTSLPELSNPATAENLAAGKQAIDSNGEIIAGTAEVCDMLANLGTATTADVTSGKTFTSVSGVNVVGTLSVKAPAVKRIAIINDGISNNISIYHTSLNAGNLIVTSVLITPNTASGTTFSAVQGTLIFMRYSSYLTLSGNVTDMNAPGSDVRVYKVT